MGSQAKLTIRVGSSRGASKIDFSSGGTYISMSTNGYQVTQPGQPILPTSDLKAFWTAVLANVQAYITANPSP